jgi:hypothetical protein
MKKFNTIIENIMTKNLIKTQSEGDIPEIIEILKFLNYDGTVSFRDIDSALGVH